MADPFTIAAGASMVATAAGAAVKAYGSYKSGQAQASAAAYQASIARMKEEIAQQNAAYAREVGEVQAQESGIKTREEIGETKAQQAGSGINVDSGSSAAVRNSQAEVGEYEQQVIRANAAHKAYGYEVEGMSDEAQARMDDFAASNLRNASYLDAFGSLLSGAGSVSEKWMKYGSTFPSGSGNSGVGNDYNYAGGGF